MTWGFHTGRPGQSGHGHCTLVAAGSLRSLHHPGLPLTGLASPVPGPRRSSAMSWGLPGLAAAVGMQLAVYVMCSSSGIGQDLTGAVSVIRLGTAAGCRALALAGSSLQACCRKQACCSCVERCMS